MTLQLFQDENLLTPLPKDDEYGYMVELPRNTPGGVVQTKFYVFNDSDNTVEDIQILHDNSQVDFIYKDWLAPKGVGEVIVEWRAPIDVKQALSLRFTVKAVEVVTPRL